MWDGREPSLVSQARNAILGHGQVTRPIAEADLEAIERFQLTDRFFSSPAVRDFAHGAAELELPQGATESEKRGRTFFEDRIDPNNAKIGTCSICHSGPLLNRANQFFPIPNIRFLSVGVSELNEARNPVRPFVFRTPKGPQTVLTPDPGVGLVTGRVEEANSFKIAPLRGIQRTAPYFHDNSARTLEEVAAHYAIVLPLFDPRVVLTGQDQADIVAFLKLLD
jgi:cytochrome c peroxidase